jgi:hypothetical protein
MKTHPSFSNPDFGFAVALSADGNKAAVNLSSDETGAPFGGGGDVGIGAAWEYTQ